MYHAMYRVEIIPINRACVLCVRVQLRWRYSLPTMYPWDGCSCPSALEQDMVAKYIPKHMYHA
jgi:hypothetical protein